MSVILRYDNIKTVVTPLNPIEDVVSWIRGLNSLGYTSDLLKNIHGISDPKEIKKCGQLISTYAENAIGFLDQAYSGSPKVSFLPLYYAILNISKIYVVLSGKRMQLPKNPWHGAKYDPLKKTSRDLLTEEITLKEQGILPLFYESLTNLPWKLQNRKIKLYDIYPYIHDISYEYEHAYKRPFALQGIRLTIKKESSGGYNLVAELKQSDHPNAGKQQYLRILKGFHSNPQQPNVFISHKVFAATEKEAHDLLLKNVKRYLLYGTMTDSLGQIEGSWTILSNKRLLFPEEIPIWIAFFHLSNVVRYNPEFLARIKDSKSWSMVLALRKHAILKFLLLFWSYLHQSQIVVRPG